MNTRIFCAIAGIVLAATACDKQAETATSPQPTFRQQVAEASPPAQAAPVDAPPVGQATAEVVVEARATAAEKQPVEKAMMAEPPAAAPAPDTARAAKRAAADGKGRAMMAHCTWLATTRTRKAPVLGQRTARDQPANPRRSSWT